jgi:hypothetical protein
MASFKDLVDQANKSENKKSGGFFQVNDGNKNLMRILTEPAMFYKDFENGICYDGCGFKGTPMGLVYVLDRGDNQVKLAELKWGLLQKLAVWEESGDYEIDGTFPMKNDIRITKEGSGKQTKYDYNLVPKVSEVPAEFLAKELKDKKTCAEIVEKWKADSKAGHTGDDVDGVDDFEMPPVDPFGGEGADEKVIQA